MKTNILKHISMAFIAMVVAASFTACDKEDTDDPTNTEFGEGLPDKAGKWTQDGDKLTFDVTDAGIHQTFEFIFDNETDNCTSYDVTYEFINEEQAKNAYATYNSYQIEKDGIELKGKKIIFTQQTIFEGIDRTTLGQTIALSYPDAEPMPEKGEPSENQGGNEGDGENQGGNEGDGESQGGNEGDGENQGGSSDTDIDYSGVELTDANKDNYSALIKREFGIDFSEEDGFEFGIADEVEGGSDGIWVPGIIDTGKADIKEMTRVYFDRLKAATQSNVYRLVYTEDEEPNELHPITDIDAFIEEHINSEDDNFSMWYKYNDQYVEFNLTYRDMTDIKKIFHASFGISENVNGWISYGVWVIVE